MHANDLTDDVVNLTNELIKNIGIHQDLQKKTDDNQDSQILSTITTDLSSISVEKFTKLCSLHRSGVKNAETNSNITQYSIFRMFENNVILLSKITGISAKEEWVKAMAEGYGVDKETEVSILLKNIFNEEKITLTVRDEKKIVSTIMRVSMGYSSSTFSNYLSKGNYTVTL